MSKKSIGLIVGAVVLAIIALLTIRYGQQPSPYNDAKQIVSTPTPAQTPPAAPQPAPAKKISYETAVNTYGKNRIQLDSACQAHPTAAVFKVGTKVMLDNRAAVSRKVVFNTVTYNIPAYDYVVVSMTAPAYPATAFIDCGSAQNVARITIEK